MNLKNINPFKAKTATEYKNEFANQTFNPNKKVVIYEDGEHTVSVPDGTPDEDREAIIQAIKGQIKNILK